MIGKTKSARLTDQPRQKRIYALWPYAAVLVFVGLAVVMLISAQYGFQNDDETTCIAGAHRIMLGELPLIKNWTVIQLHSFLEYLPFRLVYAINGGTEGIVLGVRYCYVALKLFFFVVICFFLRRYRYWAILCAVPFTVFHPIGFQTLIYYNVSILCAFAVGLLLFCVKKKSPVTLLTVGVVFAFCVLAEPATILLYFLFTLLVPVIYLATKKKCCGEPLDSCASAVGVWGWITLGGAAVACVVFTVVLSSSDLRTVLTGAPGVLRLLEFHPQTNQWGKYANYFNKMGYACHIGAAALLALIGVLKAVSLLPKASIVLRKVRGTLFAAACLLFIWMMAELYFRNGKLASVIYLTVYLPIPLCVLGLFSFLLAEKKQTRLFAFFCFGLAFAFCIDLFSRVTIFTGAIVSVPPAILLFRETLLETFARIKKKDLKKRDNRKITWAAGLLLKGTACFAAVLAMLTIITSETAHSFHARLFSSPEIIFGQPLSKQAERGPMKGLITSPMIMQRYDAVLYDMDSLKEDLPESLFVADFMLWGNLYLDLPYASFGQDSFDTYLSQDCLLYYWSLYPDAKPDCVYIPFFGCDTYLDHPEQTNAVLTFMQSICECETRTGAAGYILRIQRWK